jgi:hypothetical protein
LNSTEALTDWAKDSIPAKNTLVDADVRAVERAFEAKQSELGEPVETSIDTAVNHAAEVTSVSLATDGASINAVERQRTGTAHPRKSARRDGHGRAKRANQSAISTGPQTTQASLPRVDAPRRPVVDKSALAFDEPKRVRDKEHLRHVAAQPCLLCRVRPAEAHHIRFAQPRALGRKVSDEFTVPLCRKHHRDVHHSGNEAAWWHDMGIDPIDIALQLWDETLIARGFVPPPLLPSDAGTGSKQA